MPGEKNNFVSIIVKSTVVPSTTDTIVRNIIEKESYKKLMESDYSNSIDSIEKDFSEIMAPLCVIERGQRELKEMGYTGITKQSVKVYVPKKGNEPLLDFKLVGKDISYPFSVKKASGVTNTIKPKHIMALFNPETTKKALKDSRIEYEVLKILAEHPKPNIINGPFYLNCPVFFVPWTSDSQCKNIHVKPSAKIITYFLSKRFS